MFNENIKTTGQLEITLVDGNGKLKYQEIVPNLVVTTGKSIIASRLASNATSVITHMAIGISSTAVVAINTELGEQLGRVAINTAGGTVSENTVTYVATFAAGVCTGAITEAGLFNHASAGTMLCRTVFPVVNKDVSDVLTINWVVTIA